MLTRKDLPKNDVKNKEEKNLSQNQENKAYVVAKSQTHELSTAEQKSYGTQYSLDSHSPMNKTRIHIRFDCGFNNQLYIRGQGANLRWDKGILLKNIKADEWVWETDAKFPSCEFKILINDSIYETGLNHKINCCGSLSYTPHF